MSRRASFHSSCLDTRVWVSEALRRLQIPYELRTLSLYLPGMCTRRPPQVNISLFKTFSFTERIRLQFRAEAFTLTNTPWFGAPNVVLNSGQFGQVTRLQTNDPQSFVAALQLNF